MNKLLIKSLIMTGLSFVAASITASGLPATGLAWQVLGLTTLGTMLGYLAQSKMFPSTSTAGQVDLKDLGKALLVSASGALSGWGASAVSHTAIDWKQLLTGIVVLFMGYISKQYFTPEPKTI